MSARVRDPGDVRSDGVRSPVFVEPGGAVAESAALDDFHALVDAVRVRVDARLREWLEPRVAAAAKVSTAAEVVASAVLGLTLRGGKRVRAALVAAGFAASGRRSWSICEPAMLAVELLQTYLLIHDDWMDDDDVRRGGPAVHRLLRDALGTRALGDATAVLAGDLASAYAQAALLECDVDPPLVLRAARVFTRMQIEVTTGQVAEMCAAGRASTTDRLLPSVEDVYALKTASYTVTGPLLLGAALAGVDDAGAAELERFGRPLGIAFQLRDDLLGVFGDPSTTGKPLGSDFREGKRTLVVAELRGDPRGATLLDRVYGRVDAAPEDVEALIGWIAESGARSRVEARIRELCDEARRALDAMAPWLTQRGRACLAGAVSALGERSS